jgi:hypothetical protein
MIAYLTEQCYRNITNTLITPFPPASGSSALPTMAPTHFTRFVQRMA